MSKLYERIDHLCSERHINITTMCKESGASRGSLTDLKVGRKQSLSVETLRKIADYFNVSTDYLLGKEKTSAPLSDAEVRMEKIKEIEALLNKMDDETIIDVIKYAEYLASREGKSDEK